MADDGFSQQFAGKVAAITGGTQGVGEAVARLLAARGAAGIAICGRNARRGEEVAREISGSGCPTEYVHADLERTADGRNFIDSAEASFGRLDVLVNCASVWGRKALEDVTADDVRAQFEA